MKEGTMQDAPIEYNNEEASAWACGFDAGAEEARKHEHERMLKFAEWYGKDMVESTGYNSIEKVLYDRADMPEEFEYWEKNVEEKK